MRRGLSRAVACFFLGMTLLCLGACLRRHRSVAPAPASVAAPPPSPASIPTPSPAPAGTPPPAAAPPTAPEPTLEPAPRPTDLPRAPVLLKQADRAYAAANYAEAARSYSLFLSAAAADPDKDRALFRLALSAVLPGLSHQAMKQAEASLERLLSQYPKSPYAVEGRLLLGLVRDVQRLRAELGGKNETIKQLSGELDRLKKIDMERGAPRPPESR